MPLPPTEPDKLPRIADTDSPDIPRDMNALADATQAALQKRGGVFADAAARDAAIPAPAPGSEVYLATPGVKQTFVNGAWVYAYYLGVNRVADEVLSGSADQHLVVYTAVEPQPADTTPLVWLDADVTIPVKGVYFIDAGCLIAATSVAGNFSIGIILNRVKNIGVEGGSMALGHAINLTKQVSYPLEAGDKLSLWTAGSQQFTRHSGFMRVTMVP